MIVNYCNCFEKAQVVAVDNVSFYKPICLREKSAEIERLERENEILRSLATRPFVPRRYRSVFLGR